MSDEKKALFQIRKFADAITENIINTPDDEILDEVREDHGDQEYDANIMRDIIGKAKMQVNKKAFAKAKHDLEVFKAGQKDSPTDNEFLHGFEEKDLDDLTIAARDGKDISDKDMTGVREDWEDLKKMASWKDKGNSEKS